MTTDLTLIEQDAVQQYNATDFNDDFIGDLRSDLILLQDIQALWHQLENDPKLNQFVRDLQSHPYLKDQKVIIFTESKETGDQRERIDLLERLLQEYPKKTEASSRTRLELLNQLGKTYQSIREFDKATSYFQEAISRLG